MQNVELCRYYVNFLLKKNAISIIICIKKIRFTGALMELLKKKIMTEGEVYAGNILKVDSFLNHQIDFPFMKEVGKEFHRLFKDSGVNKILTIEASGIAVGGVVALEFECPLVFAKKNKTRNIAGDVYRSKVTSYTHGKTYDVIVSEKFLNPGDRVLIVDDFLAVGNALRGLIDIVHQSGAELVGCGSVIEKGYQHGGDQLREEGIRVESLAIVESMNAETGEIIFRD